MIDLNIVYGMVKYGADCGVPGGVILKLHYDEYSNRYTQLSNRHKENSCVLVGDDLEFSISAYERYEYATVLEKDKIINTPSFDTCSSSVKESLCKYCGKNVRVFKATRSGYCTASPHALFEKEWLKFISKEEAYGLSEDYVCINAVYIRSSIKEAAKHLETVKGIDDDAYIAELESWLWNAKERRRFVVIGGVCKAKSEANAIKRGKGCRNTVLKIKHKIR